MLINNISYANSKIDSLKQLVAQYPTKDTTYCKLLMDISEIYLIHTVEMDSTEIYLNSLLDVARTIKSRNYEVKALGTLAQVNFFKGDLQTAERNIELALTKAKIPLRQSALHLFASTINSTQGEFNQAIQDLELARQTQPNKESEQWLGFMAYYHNSLADIYKQMEQHVETFKQHMIAYQYAVKVKNKRTLAITLINISEDYISFENYDKANIYLEEAATTASDDLRVLYRIYAKLMQNNIELGCLSEAHRYFYKAIEIKKEIIEITTISKLYIHRSKAFLLEHKLDSAYYYAQQGLNTSKSQSVIKDIADSYFMLSKLASYQQDYTQALQYFKKGKAQGTTVPAEVNKQMATVQAKLSNWKAAYQHLQQGVQQQDSIFDKKAILTINSDFLTHRFNLEQERQQLLNDKKEAVLEAQITRQYGMLGFASFMVLTLTIGTFLLNKWYREKKRANALIAAQKENIQQANDIKSRIFYVLGHDLRGPIGNVDTLFGEIMNGNISLKEFEELLPYLKKNITGVSLTLNNILHWGLAQTKQLKIALEPVHIQHEVSLAKSLLEGLIQQKQITFVDKVQEDLVVRTDNAKLNLIIRNLIANSIKYTPPEGKIEVRTTTIEKEVIISVSDSGIGMSPDIQAKLFDNPISQDGTRQEKGTGIGLNLCRQMLEEMGGRIWVESILGKGSTFSFTLPVR